MALDRIPAVALPAPARPGSAEVPRLAPSAGETLQITLNSVLLDDVFATTADGLPLRLAGLGHLANQLVSGDVLLVRVLATTPRLELALFETPRRPETPPVQPQAMQADQLSQRRMNWRPPQAAALAQSWQAMVLGQVDGTPAAAPPGGEAALGPHRWLFPAYAWAGLHVMLRLVEDDEDEPPLPSRRRRGPMALRIEVDVPRLGGVVLQLQLLPQGVALLFFVQHEQALPVVRQAVPAITQTLAAAGLRLLRCGVVMGPPPRCGATRLDSRPDGRSESRPTPVAQLLPPLLFRAAAEVTVALAPLLPGGEVSPASQ